MRLTVSKGQKEVRIADTLEPLLGAHKLIVYEPAIQYDYQTALSPDGLHDPSVSLFHQMTRLTRERGALAHDDRLDALALACAFFQEQMTADDRKGIVAAQEEWLELQMESSVSGYQDAVSIYHSGITVSWESDDW